jgi:hypothetical protein
MHPYVVIVSDTQDNKTLAIPCAEAATAELVEKNLKTLFPNYNVKIQKEEKLLMSTTLLKLSRATVPTTSEKLSTDSDYSILEKDLFDDVA